MKKRRISLFVLLFIISILAAGCGKTEQVQSEKKSEALQSEQDKQADTQKAGHDDIITPTAEIVSLEDDFAVVHYAGDDKLDEFLEQGGASSDADVMEFLTKYLLSGKSVLEFWVVCLAVVRFLQRAQMEVIFLEEILTGNPVRLWLSVQNRRRDMHLSLQ